MDAALHVLILVGKLCALSPSMESSQAAAHAISAVVAEDLGTPAELLLAVAYVESRFDPTATSRVEHGRRVGGRWPSRSQAGERAPRFCGVMQVRAGVEWSSCLQQRPILVGYSTGARELRAWLKMARGDLRGALRGYGCGMAGMRGECRRYDLRVLAIARRLGWRPVIVDG